MKPLRNMHPGPRLKPALLALIPVVVAGALLAHVTTGVVKSRALATARGEAELVSKGVFEVRVRARHLERGLRPSQRRAARRAFRQLADREQIAGATLWSRAQQRLVSVGRVDDPGSENPRSLRSALAGASATDVLSPARGPKLLKLYLPLRGRVPRRPAGVVEVEMPYGPIAAAPAHDSRKLYLTLGITLALMYAALLVIVMASTEPRQRGGEGQTHMHRDPLTGLPNRLFFHEVLERAVMAGRRKRTLTAVMVMDLDRFKEINDTLGHFNGDQLLARLAGRLRSVMRDADTIARLGGDEFAILMPDMPARDAVRSAADRILQTLEEPFVVGGIALQVQGSIGISLFPEHGNRADALLQTADVAMYEAKREQSRFAFYSPEQHHQTPDRLAMVAELRRAVESGELAVQYQPQAELATGVVRRAEALVRWQHPRKGPMNPDDFVALAEQIGLMRPLTLHVLETALMQCRAWQDDGLHLGVGVNLATQNLIDLQFPDDLARLLAKSKVPPSLLELEITERTIMSDPRRTLTVLERLRSMGVKLAVDDFGTGHSSLAYLKDLPVSTIKIDKSFVLQMEESGEDAAIVRSTIDLAHSLGMEAVAEGVENDRIWARLAECGCDLAQGYLLAKPLPAADLTGWLSARSGSKGERSAQPAGLEGDL